jgi:hypothetical protein
MCAKSIRHSVIVVSIGRLINVVEIGEKLNIDPTCKRSIALTLPGQRC